jgi:hypothetical protein
MIPGIREASRGVGEMIPGLGKLAGRDRRPYLQGFYFLWLHPPGALAHMVIHI